MEIAGIPHPPTPPPLEAVFIYRRHPLPLPITMEVQTGIAQEWQEREDDDVTGLFPSVTAPASILGMYERVGNNWSLYSAP